MGVDLGLGKFQFDFEREEDIDGVLRMQPYHFDYWMLSVAQWQPRMAQSYPVGDYFLGKSLWCTAGV